MTERDLKDCAAIIDRTELFRAYDYRGEAAERQLRAALQDPGYDLRVVREGGSANGRAIGFAWFAKKGAFMRSGYLRLIAVDPEIRSKGVGKLLLEALEQDYRNPHGLFLLVTETNTQARRFYEKLGYSHLGTIPDYVKPGIHECIYFKPAEAQGSPHA